MNFIPTFSLLLNVDALWKSELLITSQLKKKDNEHFNEKRTTLVLVITELTD